MIRITDLLKVADVFQASTDVSDTTLSFRVFNDSKKLAALRAGSDITVGRYNTACRWFSENWPEGLDWPTGVTRPVEEATP